MPVYSSVFIVLNCALDVKIRCLHLVGVVSELVVGAVGGEGAEADAEGEEGLGDGRVPDLAQYNYSRPHVSVSEMET